MKSRPWRLRDALWRASLRMQTHVSVRPALSHIQVANAFANAANLEPLSTGVALLLRHRYRNRSAVGDQFNRPHSLEPAFNLSPVGRLNIHDAVREHHVEWLLGPDAHGYSYGGDQPGPFSEREHACRWLRLPVRLLIRIRWRWPPNKSQCGSPWMVLEMHRQTAPMSSNFQVPGRRISQAAGLPAERMRPQLWRSFGLHGSQAFDGQFEEISKHNAKVSPASILQPIQHGSSCHRRGWQAQREPTRAFKCGGSALA